MQDQNTKTKQFDWLIIGLFLLLLVVGGTGYSGYCIYDYRTRREAAKKTMLRNLSSNHDLESYLANIDKIEAFLKYYPALQAEMAPRIRKWECRVEETKVSCQARYYSARSEYTRAANVWIDLRSKYPHEISDWVDSTIRELQERMILEPELNKVYNVIRSGKVDEAEAQLKFLLENAKSISNQLELRTISDSVTNKQFLRDASKIATQMIDDTKKAEENFKLLTTWGGRGCYLHPSVKAKALELHRLVKGNENEFDDWYSSLPLAKAYGIWFNSNNNEYLMEIASRNVDYVLQNCKDIETLDRVTKLKSYITAYNDWKKLATYAPFEEFYQTTQKNK
ncbi:hypothetical protein ACFL54_05995 [Planctomycetota bacterium]